MVPVVASVVASVVDVPLGRAGLGVGGLVVLVGVLLLAVAGTPQQHPVPSQPHPHSHQWTGQVRPGSDCQWQVHHVHLAQEAAYAVVCCCLQADDLTLLALGRLPCVPGHPLSPAHLPLGSCCCAVTCNDPHCQSAFQACCCASHGLQIVNGHALRSACSCCCSFWIFFLLSPSLASCCPFSPACPLPACCLCSSAYPLCSGCHLFLVCPLC